MTEKRPTFCQYTAGACDQDFSNLETFKGFFIHPSQPRNLALTIQEAVKELQIHSSKDSWKSWEELIIGGQIIFCKICQAIYKAERIVANITNLNFNVLFELGYAIGLHKPVVPVRDGSYTEDSKIFEYLGLFDVLGCENFQNSKQLVSIAMKKLTSPLFPKRQFEINKQQPIYYIKSPIDSEGSIKIGSALKKSAFRFRVFDWRETPRLSLHEAYKQVLSSMAVVAHLIDSNRDAAGTHNPLAAFVCGMAMASGKQVLMLQEGTELQPIDYRDVVIPYTDYSTISHHVEKFVRAIADTALSIANQDNTLAQKGLLEKIDIGDVAAENEIRDLQRYFVRTPQYQQAIQGHARLVVGRKGTGKTAIFYGIYDKVSKNRDILCIDLKPEGHQFVKLRERILSNMSEGLRLHTLTAFWNYLLLLEITKKIVESEGKNAYFDPLILSNYKKLEAFYKERTGDEEGDFSVRLMRLTNKIIEDYPANKSVNFEKFDMTQLIYKQGIKELNTTVIKYLEKYDQVWILFDNLDKGWPAHGAKPEDIEILRCLLEATRKLQRALQRKSVDLKSTVFIRKDIYDILIDQTPDRGKEPAVNLDWSDPLLLQRVLENRFNDNEGLQGDFKQVWTKLFDAHVGGEDSFHYILDRTLERPRELLNFVQKCINLAISHNNDRVKEENILAAEVEFSEVMLYDLRYEIRDVFPQFSKVVLQFQGQNSRLSKDDLSLILMEAGLKNNEINKAIDSLLWFSFLGIADTNKNEDRFSHQVMYSLEKLKSYMSSRESSASIYTIHPGFRKALGIESLI